MALTMSQAATPAITDFSQTDTITDVFVRRVEANPEAHMFSMLKGGREEEISAGQFLGEVRAVAKGLIQSGVKPGDRVAIFGATSYRWTLFDYAIWFAGGVSVPFYDTSSQAQLEWMITDAEVTFAVVESSEHQARIAAASGDAATLPTVVWSNSDYDALIDTGRELPTSAVEEARTSRRASDTATLIYTSGTTGKSRGCILSHSNFVHTAQSAAVQLPEVVRDGARCLLFIPTAHVFARFIQVMTVNHGVVLAHEADLTKLTESLALFRPTFILGVPRVFEKVFNSALAKAESEGKGKVFRAAEAVAVKYSRARTEGKVPALLKAQHAVFDKLVYSKLRTILGGQATHAVSGGGPLGEHLGHFFAGIGVDILEGYGLTETTAPITVNTPGASKVGTVGVPLPGCAIAIAPDGEVLAKGVSVFQGYLNNDEATEAAFADGWFMTGDLGKLDADGYLKVTGRKKEIIITAGGKNIAPAPLEDELRRHPIIAQPVVIGEGQKFVSALIFLDPEMLPAWLSNHKLPDMTLEEAAQNDTVREAVSKAIDRVNRNVSRAESIREFRIVPTVLTEDNGYLSAKQSVKRHIINKDFAADIAAIYGT